MYTSFFGFAEKPFEVTPDPKFLYLSPSHREMLASLVYGIGERRGFITLVGEVGTGKTTLINAALDRLEGNTKVAYLCNTALTFDQMLLMVLQELSLVQPGQRVSKIEAIRLLNDFAIRQLSEGGNVVLIIDEAQNLDAVSMENLRLLSNLETRKHKLIQIVLAGQPELDAKLRRPDLRQLAQRVSMRRSIAALEENETYEYIHHRLTVSDYKGRQLFSKGAKNLIHGYSGGIPRKINILCDNALLIGYALKKKTIDADCVEEAAQDLDWDTARTANQPTPTTPTERSPQPGRIHLNPRIALAGGIALGLALLIIAWHAFGKSGIASSLSSLPSSGSSVQASIDTFKITLEQQGPQGVAILPAEGASSGQVGVETGSLEKGDAESESGDLKAAENPSTQEAPAPLTAAVNANPSLVSATTVTVKKGDWLYKIIARNYGTYDKPTLDLVLKENAEISSPDKIYEGQVIKLPEVK
jgi:general secretion pathway protein A